MARLAMDRSTAKALRARYWSEHGTTLAGLMAHHGIDPWDFLHDVHDIDMSGLRPAPDLAAQISTLPGRAIVYTNGDAFYARRVLAALGLSDVFEGIYGIEHADWRPKPDHAAFEKVFMQDGLDPATSAMFEDDPRNLAVPHAMGLRTVFVAPDAVEADHIHHHTDDLSGFLSQVLATAFPDAAPRPTFRP